MKTVQNFHSHHHLIIWDVKENGKWYAWYKDAQRGTDRQECKNCRGRRGQGRKLGGQRMKERNMVGITLCKGKTSWGARGSRWAQGGTAVVKHSWAARKGLGT